MRGGGGHFYIPNCLCGVWVFFYLHMVYIAVWQFKLPGLCVLCVHGRCYIIFRRVASKCSLQSARIAYLSFFEFPACYPPRQQLNCFIIEFCSAFSRYRCFCCSQVSVIAPNIFSPCAYFSSWLRMGVFEAGYVFLFSIREKAMGSIGRLLRQGAFSDVRQRDA